jgi:hypothetical protein
MDASGSGQDQWWAILNMIMNLSVPHVFMEWRLVKHRDNFTLLYSTFTLHFMSRTTFLGKLHAKQGLY